MSKTSYLAWLPAQAILTFTLLPLCLSDTASAQSSSRVDVLPTISPVQAQPTYAPFPQGQAIPQQGSATRGMPVEGQIINSQPIVGGPIVEGMPQSNSVYGSNVGSVMSGSSTRGSSTRGTAAAAPRAGSFESKFWNYLVRSKYRNWAPVPGQSDGAYEGQSPHGAYLKMFLNRKAAGNSSSLPDGSIVIKENYSPEQALAAITVMYKTSGYNAKAGDWYWVKYNPDGTVASKSTDTGSVRLAGRVKGCIECHSDADGDDFVFFND